jgi:hypothetical protein
MKQHFWSPADVELELAWVPPQHRLVEPVRATPLYESFSGTIWNSVVESYPAPIDPHLVTAEVTLHHPDVGPMKALVAFDDLKVVACRRDPDFLGAFPQKGYSFSTEGLTQTTRTWPR